MSKKFLGVFLFCLCLSLTVQAQVFNAQTFFLDNGLQVVVIENHKAPIIKQMLVYKAGAVDEKVGKGGVAHLLEHLMFRGTKKVRGQEFNRIMEKNGAESNAFTAQDMTAYYQFIDVSRLELAMLLEADLMKNLAFTGDDFSAERSIVFQERKQRVDNNPTALFSEKVKKVLWQNHPYGNPVTGRDEEILDLTEKDVFDFYHRYYAPNNAVLVLSGDIDLQTAKNLANKYYGSLKPVKIEQKEFIYLPQVYKARLEMSLPEVKIAKVVRIYVVPSFIQNPKRAYALDVLSEYLTGDRSAPMYQKLVVKEKKALGVDASYDGISRSFGTFVLSAVPVQDANQSFEKSLSDAFNQAIKEITPEKVEKVKRKMLADLVYLQDSPSSAAEMVALFIASGGKLEDLNGYAENLKRVTVEDVKEAVRLLSDKTPQVIGILYPQEKTDE